MANRKVGALARIYRDGKEITVKLERKPGNALEFYPVPGGSYYLRWSEGSKQKMKLVGRNIDEVVPAIRRQEQLLAGRMVIERDRPTVQRALEVYLEEVQRNRRRHTYTGYKDTLEQFLKTVPMTYLDEVCRDRVLEYKYWLRDQDYAPRSVYNKLLIVVTFTKAAGLPRLLRRGDWPKYEERDPLGYSDGEIKAMRDIATEKEHDVLLAFLDTGWRKGEISNLLWKNVDFPNRRVIAQEEEGFQTKDNERKCIGLTNRLYERLSARRARGPRTSMCSLIERVALTATLTASWPSWPYAPKSAWTISRCCTRCAKPGPPR